MVLWSDVRTQKVHVVDYRYNPDWSAMIYSAQWTAWNFILWSEPVTL